MNLRVLGILVLVPLLLPAPASSQTQDEATEACIRAIPRSDFKRVGVAIEATVYDSDAAPMLFAADLLTQAVALRVRTLLGGSETELPAADSLVHWRHTWGSVVVTVSRDGAFKWRAARSSAEADTVQRSTLKVVQRAISEVAAEGERMMWPDGIRADSIMFEIMVKKPLVARGGKEEPLPARMPIPMFTVEVPWGKPVEMLRKPRIAYPEQSRSGRATGGIRVAYVIDEKGEVVPGSIEEHQPEIQPPPPPYLINYYRAFVRAVERGLPSARFSPALIGGCPVRQRVTQVFDFDFK